MGMILNPYSFISPIAVQTTTFQTSATDLTTYTFSSVAISGSWDGLIVTIGCRGTAARTANSVTAGGNAMTFGGRLNAGFQTAEIWAIKQGGSTSETFVVTWSGGCSNMILGVIAVKGLQSAAIHGSAVTSTANPFALSINTIAGGIAVGATFWSNRTSANSSWSGLTEFYDDPSEGQFGGSGAYALTPTAETPRAISCTETTYNTNDVSVCVVYR